MLTLLYLAGAGALLGVAGWAIIVVRRRRVNGWLVGWNSLLHPRDDQASVRD